MPKFDADARAHFVELIRETLAEAGFTGISLVPSALPEATVASLRSGGDDDEVPFASPAFAEEVGYHRIITDQASFGIWFEPYVTVDLAGTGVSIAAFYPTEAAGDIPDDWYFAGFDEDVFKTLFVELAKKSRQP